jgi:short-subunit dehydrogenase
VGSSGHSTAPPWRRALVTGASSGIGLAFATELAAGGTELVLVARRRERLDELARDLRSAHGCTVEVLCADLADDDQLAVVEARLLDTAAPVDLLVNSAGFGTRGDFAGLPLDREEQEIRINVVVPVRLTSAALPGMIDRGRGGVVNVSSIAALQPIPHWATYAATKAYLTSFSEALHEEVKDRGVAVLALMPGFTRTEFQDRAGVAASPVPGPLWMSADDVARSGLRALAQGRAAHVVGLRNRALAMASGLSPRGLTRRVARAVGRRI